MRPTDLPTRNVTLLRRTIDWIEKHPEQHAQEDWLSPCGAKYCYAGHAAILAGAQAPGVNVAGDYWMIELPTLHALSHSDGHTGVAAVHVSEFAQEQLGLTEIESEVMFELDRTRAELRILVEALVAGAWIDDECDIWADDVNQGPVEKWLEKQEVKEDAL